MSKITAQQFHQYLNKYDANNDGVIDEKDIQTLQQGWGAFINRDKINALRALLASDPNGVIDRNDVLKRGENCCKHRERNYYPGRSRARKGNGGSSQAARSARQKDELAKKLDELRKAKDVDLANPAAPWKSDDIAREIVLKNPHLLKNATPEQLALLLSALRDAGSGQFASVGPDDRKAILKILESIPPEQRAQILDLAGGRDKFERFFSGAELSKFRALADEYKKAESYRNELNDLMNKLESAFKEDIKDPRKAWKSDDIAREIALKKSHLLRYASDQQLIRLLKALRDAGSGQFASVGYADRKAILKILE